MTIKKPAISQSCLGYSNVEGKTIERCAAYLYLHILIFALEVWKGGDSQRRAGGVNGWREQPLSVPQQREPIGAGEVALCSLLISAFYIVSSRILHT